MNDTIPRDSYDVVVFGAGLGGMTAASLLAKRGLSVLMIDRRSFAGQPVRIAELLQWVVENAGSEGWPKREAPTGREQRVAVLGGNLAETTCAAYLALAGCTVDVLECGDGAQVSLGAAQGELGAARSMGVRLHMFAPRVSSCNQFSTCCGCWPMVLVGSR